MSDAPELLWLWPAEPEDGVDKFVSFPGQPYPSGSTTYIRADLSDAMLREAMAEARSLLVDAMVQLTDGKIKTRRNRALLIQDFLSRAKEQSND